MNGNFVYCNPTKLYFGEDSLDFLNEELPKSVSYTHLTLPTNSLV